jgi:hypothetical protein
MDAKVYSTIQLVVAVSTVIYTVLLVFALRWLRRGGLKPLLAGDDPSAKATVVIAARNEADNLGLCLRSLLDQAGVVQIRVVDDHSTDATASVVENFQKRDPRVVLLSAPELPAAWLGKNHALQFGAQQVPTRFLLFTDADVIFGCGIVAKALRRMDEAKLDHLGGHFFVDCRTAPEEILAPILVLSSGLALFSTAKTQGAATGAFNLVRTATYHLHGSHMPIKGEIVDDVALARHLKSRGANSEFVGMEDFVKVRLFRGLPGFVAAVKRSAIPFLRLGAVPVLVMTLLCMVFAMLPVISGLAGFYPLRAAGGSITTVVMAVFGLLPYFLGLFTVSMARGFHNGRSLFQLLYPCAMLILAASVFSAAIDQIRGRPVGWRGRLYCRTRSQRDVPTETVQT